jgi:hypothetical protein
MSDEDRSKEWNFMYDEKKEEKFIEKAVNSPQDYV